MSPGRLCGCRSRREGLVGCGLSICGRSGGGDLSSLCDIGRSPRGVGFERLGTIFSGGLRREEGELGNVVSCEG
jgi:hypothetical protein